MKRLRCATQIHVCYKVNLITKDNFDNITLLNIARLSSMNNFSSVHHPSGKSGSLNTSIVGSSKKKWWAQLNLRY